MTVPANISTAELYERRMAAEAAQEAAQAKLDAEARATAQEAMRQSLANWDHARQAGFKPEPGRTRYDGWTPDKQAMFLQALSEGHAVTKACQIVGMSKQTAYALRESPRGAGFRLGWEAALLIARNALADELMERAFNGVKEWVEDVDGNRRVRLRHDNRLGMAMLNRLDRMAEAPASPAQAAARLIAADFAQYIDLIGRDAGPARAGVFLCARIEGQSADELTPLRTLARADRWLRTNTDLAEPLDLAGLDPAKRATWTAEQWARAEEAGLLQLAPPEPEPEPEPETPPSSQFSQVSAADEPVWWDEDQGEWRTNFPPPEGFDGDACGDPEDPMYDRSLSEEEEAIMGGDPNLFSPEEVAKYAADRDAYFSAKKAASLQNGAKAPT